MKDIEKPTSTNLLNRKAALGKGISSLIRPLDEESDEPNLSLQAAEYIIYLEPAKIKINPKQPRKYFEQKKLEELATSIANDGILQPLIVTEAKLPNGDRSYTLVAGERRLRASKLAGLEKIPVIIKNISPDELLKVALIENIQRADLNVIEEAQAIRTLIDELSLTQEQCAIKLGKDRSTIANLLRLLNLPAEVLTDLMAEKISMGHARALIPLEDSDRIIQLKNIIVENDLSVRQTEQLVKKTLKVNDNDQLLENEKDDLNNINPNLEYMADKIRSHLKTKVSLTGTSSRGKIVVSYFSEEELERLIEVLTH